MRSIWSLVQKNRKTREEKDNYKYSYTRYFNKMQSRKKLFSHINMGKKS